MMKVYKQNNKLIIYLPSEISKEFGINENDELDYFKFNDKSFLIVKKADIMGMITGVHVQKTAVPQPEAQIRAAPSQAPTPSLSNEEIAILKKLDTLRYPQRSVENVGKILSSNENSMLQGLLKKKAVSLFKKDGKSLYSISKDIYDSFLMRKKAASGAAVGTVQASAKQSADSFKKPQSYSKPYAEPVRSIYNPNHAPEISELEEKGYVVLQTETEAARLSLMLEDSIKHGQVLGTRSFSNKKFFIVTRGYLDRYVPSIFKMLRSGQKKVQEIADANDIESDAVRAMLYILAENGEIIEKKKDVFAVA